MNDAGRRRWLALIALALSGVLIGLDVTVLNLALPTLAAALHASSGDLQWFIDAYTLVFAAVVLPAGLLGDRYGRKRLLLVGLVLFGLASGACAASGSAGALIVARAGLGLGAAFVIALSFSVIPVLFAEEERQKAIAILASAAFLAYPIGPVLGGWLLSNYWWGWVFLMNLPIVVLAVAAVVVFMPESRSSRRRGLDLPGVLLSSAGLTALTYGVIEAGQKSWGSVSALMGIVVGVVVLGVFWAWERRTAGREGGEPLIELSLFRSRGFTWGTILATMTSFAMFGLLFAMPQYFIEVLGRDAMGAGVRLLPLIGGLMVGVFIASAAAGPRRPAAGGAGAAPRIGSNVLVAVGFALMAVGLGLGATTVIDSSDSFALAWFVVVGAGLGFALPATMNAALGAISAERSGVGTALIMALRFVGSTIGVAVLGTILSSEYRSNLVETGLPASVAHAARASVTTGVAVAQKLGSPTLLHAVRVAFVDAMDVMLWVTAAIALAAAALALAFLPSLRARPARATSFSDEDALHIPTNRGREGSPSGVWRTRERRDR